MRLVRIICAWRRGKKDLELLVFFGDQVAIIIYMYCCLGIALYKVYIRSLHSLDFSHH
jgi:hypothetical protein